MKFDCIQYAPFGVQLKWLAGKFNYILPKTFGNDYVSDTILVFMRTLAISMLHAWSISLCDNLIPQHIRRMYGKIKWATENKKKTTLSRYWTSIDPNI